MDGSVSPPRVIAGTEWAIPKDGPWGGHYPCVKILDVREGWVRYAYEGAFPDNRMEEDAFVRLYKPLAAFERGVLQ